MQYWPSVGRSVVAFLKAMFMKGTLPRLTMLFVEDMQKNTSITKCYKQESIHFPTPCWDCVKQAKPLEPSVISSK